MISWFINSYERLPPDVPSVAVRLSNIEYELTVQ
jgi:hypothetical protein